jgi:hypothetical protein
VHILVYPEIRRDTDEEGLRAMAVLLFQAGPSVHIYSQSFPSSWWTTGEDEAKIAEDFEK